MKSTAVIYIILLFQLTGIISAGFLECSENTDCIADNSVCTANICKCPVGQIFNLEGTKCLPLAIGLEAECEDDAQCAWLLGKHRCNGGKCGCEEGWRYSDGQCVKVAGLNEACSADRDCFNNYDILAMVCKENICTCNDGYYLRGDYDCRPEATSFGDYCSLDSDCKMANGACIGSFCVNTADSAYLRNYSHQIEDFPVIKPISEGYADIDCESNDDCTSVTNSICYALTKKCICKRGYFSTDTGCVAELGVDVGCTSDSQCSIAPGRCIDGKCYCRQTYFYSESNRACQKPMTQDNLFCNNAERCYVYGTEVTCLAQNCRCTTSAELDNDFICRIVEDPGNNGGCNSNEDCTDIVNSICSIDAQCICPDNYRLENNICLPNIGAACDIDGTKPCEMENTMCSTDNVCTCIPNHVPNGITNCLRTSAGLDDDCEIDTQCSEIVRDTICTENACQCIDNYIAINETCHAQKYMGDICTRSIDCHVMLGSKVQCRNSICQCSADMQPTPDQLDCESSAPSMFLQINSLLLTAICYLTLKFSM